MVVSNMRGRISLGAVAVLLVACSDGGTAPTGPGDGSSLQPQHSMHQMDVASLAAEPFLFRAPLDPYKIHQLPDFLMHSQVRSDIVFQQAVFAPGPGPWHTHPGPSFVYVVEGEIKLERFTPKTGCTETPVFTGGETFVEVANEVHRPVVGSAGAVVLVTRFNIPEGAAITVPAADPGC